MLRLSDQIHAMYVEAAAKDDLRSAQPLLDCLCDFNAPPEEHDTAWTELLSRYAAGPRQLWAVAVLETMRVDLLAELASLHALPPVITRDDIAQQLVIETLVAALQGPTNPARWTRHRLLTRATTAVQRWLVAEIERLSETSDEEWPVSDTSGPALAVRELLVEVQAGRLPAKGLVMLYRQEVVGESLEELAEELGISVGALRKRRDRAVAALRRRLADAA